MSKLQTIVAAALLAATLTSVAGAEAITQLALTERIGLARTDEPVRMGVPLPAGLVKDVADLSLAGENGQPIPSQATVAMRWPDGSLRWVQLVFKASVPAKGTTMVQLLTGKPAASPDKLIVAKTAAGVTVTNGYLKLAVKGAGFNVIDTLAFDPAGQGAHKPLINAHSQGLVAEIDGKTFKSSNDKSATVVVEEQGSESVVLKATGHLVDDAGKGVLAYTCRIHLFAGSPMIKLDYSYTNDQGAAPADRLSMKSLSVSLPLASPATGFMIGGEGRVYEGPLAAGQAAGIAAVDSDKSVIVAGQKEIGTAKGKSTKPVTIGWASADSGEMGLAVGVRWFWQMFPKAIRVEPAGLTVGLWSDANDAALDVFMGQGRTHYLTLLPHGKMSAAQVNTAMAARQAPLRAVASPAYYCRVSKGFGLVADSDPSIYPADLVEAAKNYDRTLKSSVEMIVKKIDGHSYQGVTMDSYGYMAFGDLFHWANKKGDPSPANILWESNYYDYPWACGLQFARTGDQQFLDVMETNGLHLGDVFMCKWHPQEKLRGACRYSPPANHVGLDSSEFKPYVSVEFNHHKAQSMLARYLLLGDLTGRDHFMLALNNAVKNPEASWGQCRGPGAKLATLYEGYLLTGEQLCLDKMKPIVDAAVKNKTDCKRFSKQGKSGYFMMGIAMEGLLYYNWLTADKETAATVQAMCDFLLDGRGLQGPQTAYPLAFTWRQTGDQKYRDAAVKLLSKSGTEARPKGFGMSWRSTPYAWYYLSKAYEADQGAKATK